MRVRRQRPNLGSSVLGLALSLMTFTLSGFLEFWTVGGCAQTVSRLFATTHRTEPRTTAIDPRR